MPAERLTMRKIREILRLRLGEELSIRAVGQSCGVSPSTVTDYTLRAKVAGLAWPLPPGLDDAALESMLFPGQAVQAGRAVPDYARVHKELKRRGVTLQLLWQEYKAQHGARGLQYTQFCSRYRAWRKQIDVVMRQSHRAGEKLFVDFAGMTLPVVTPSTGEVTEMQVFVAVLGASNFTFAMLVRSQSTRDWTAAHVAALEYFGGTAAIWVPDNLKAGVAKPDLYEPDINASYAELAAHYGAVVIPARVRKPKDKAKVENGVLQVERWVLAPLRNQTFFSLESAQRAVRERLDALNDRPFSKVDGTRRSWFQTIDRPALRPLPSRRFEHGDWKCNVGVNIDFHFTFEHHQYSVPHPLVGKRVDVRATDRAVEVFYRGRRVACHARSAVRGGYTTADAHRPKSHQRYGDWSPERLRKWAAAFGPHTEALVRHILASRPHPEQGFRSALGVLRLAKRYGADRLERACLHAMTAGATSYRSVSSILKHGLDSHPMVTDVRDLTVMHGNIRGSDYYQ